MAWQGVIRNQARNYENTVIICQPGHEFLYADFAKQFIIYAPDGKKPNMWSNIGTHFNMPSELLGFMWIGPQNFFQPNAPQQRHRLFGPNRDPDKRNFICYHARNLSKYGSDYINWPREKWEELLADYKEEELVCIGNRVASMYIKGLDYRDVSLAETCGILGSSKFIIGPSSGPMHLASLCNTPQLVWSGYARSVPRYLTEWNPHNSPVKMINDGDQWSEGEPWQPEVTTIREAMEEWLDCLTPSVQ